MKRALLCALAMCFPTVAFAEPIHSAERGEADGARIPMFDPSSVRASGLRGGAINSIVGDVSFVDRYGHAPTAEEDAREADRIRTHLSWVERELRARDVSHLPRSARESRARLLDALSEYTARGEFPRNEHFPGRRPRFIDADGNICAVGRLIEVSAGRELAQAIDDRFEYAYLLDMHDERLDRWIATSGFTAVELAMIQPSYDFERPIMPRPRPIEPPPPVEWTSADLRAQLSSASAVVSTCSDGQTRSVRVTVTHGGRQDLRVIARSRPRARTLEACVEQALHANIARAGRAAPRRSVRAAQTFTLETQRSTTLAVQAEIGAATAQLQACMPPPPPGPTRYATLSIRVALDGRLSLTGARLPMTYIDGSSRNGVLECMTHIVSQRTVPASGRVETVSHRIAWGGTLPGAVHPLAIQP
jgi:hypothetical protein